MTEPSTDCLPCFPIGALAKLVSISEQRLAVLASKGRGPKRTGPRRCVTWCNAVEWIGRRKAALSGEDQQRYSTAERRLKVERRIYELSHRPPRPPATRTRAAIDHATADYDPSDRRTVLKARESGREIADWATWPPTF